MPLQSVLLLLGNKKYSTRLGIELSRRGRIEFMFKKAKSNLSNVFKQKNMANIALLIE